MSADLAIEIRSKQSSLACMVRLASDKSWRKDNSLVVGNLVLGANSGSWRHNPDSEDLTFFDPKGFLRIVLSEVPLPFFFKDSCNELELLQGGEGFLVKANGEPSGEVNWEGLTCKS